MELPPAPWYRRWSFLLAGVIGLAAITALLGWRGLQQVPGSTTTLPATTTPPTTASSPPTTTTETSFGPTSKPDEILWEQVGSEVATSHEFRAPSTWRIVWSFDCSNFADLGGGNFKITGTGAFSRIQIQAFDTKASGTQTYTKGGFGQLQVDSVCKRWSVRVLSG
jgi:hypothetical protein